MQNGAGLFYELYFYWFIPAHEMGHILRACYGTRDNSHWSEEIACNEFAVAYWTARGERERLRRLQEFMNPALRRLEDPVPAGEDRAAYFDNHYSEPGSNPPAYAHYQLSMVLTALNTALDFYEGLRTIITSQASEATPPPAATYTIVNAELPTRIVGDMREYLALYGVSLPEMEIVPAYTPQIEFVDWD